jgi:kinesin family protein 5
MEGPDIYDPQYRGIIPRTVEALFEGVSNAAANMEFTIRVSYVEIYCEKIRDLLDRERLKTNLMIREDKIRGTFITTISF